MLITALYVSLVVGLGAVLPRVPGAEAVSPFLAAAAVAVAFNPLRTRLARMADRLVHGHRASPYEVLADTTRRVAATLSAADAVPVMAQALAGGTAATAAVWLREPGGWRLGAVAPASATAPKVGDGQIFEVRHGEEVLGALVIDRVGALTATERGLASDLAAQAGMLLRNAVLVDELRASASRLVAVQESTRRRLERDLHDGAQQQLTAVAMKLGLARSLLPDDPCAARVTSSSGIPTPRSRRCATSHAGCSRRCSPPRAWPPPCPHAVGGCRCPRGSVALPIVTRRRSRRRCTSAASRRCTTW